MVKAFDQYVVVRLFRHTRNTSQTDTQSGQVHVTAKLARVNISLQSYNNI